MPVRAAGLTAAKVRTAEPGRYGDGDGLYLLVRSPATAFWIFRYTRSGRLREMGLGRDLLRKLKPSNKLGTIAA
jgi:hypothetical protein